jgi:hypothetical protein
VAVMPSKLSKQPDFPMKFKVFLRWVVPGPRLYDERFHIYRKFLYEYHAGMWDLHPGHAKDSGYQSSDQEADTLIARLVKYGLSGSNYDTTLFFETKRQLEQWRNIKRIQQRKNALQSRWLKYYRKKLLRLLKNRRGDIS